MYRLYNGDCLEIMPTLESGSIDAIITDLPYGTTACKWDAIIPFEQMWREVKRVLKPNGAFVTTASQPFTSALVMSNPKWFKYEWIWNKESGGAFVRVKYRPLQTHENICVFGCGTITYNPKMEFALSKNIRPINNGSSGGNAIPVSGGVAKSANDYDKTKRYPKTIITMSRYIAECNSTNRIHATQKPVALYEYLIRTYTNEGETVLDITMGSGTTIVAAELTGRNSIGIEKDPDIFKTAQDRILNMYNAPKKVKKPKSDNGLQMELV